MSDLPDVFVFGHNRFGQFRKPIMEENGPKLDWEQFGGPDLGKDVINFNFNATVNYSAIAFDFQLVISTMDCKKVVTEDAAKPESLRKTFEFKDLIAKISSNSKFCLVLLENGDTFKITIQTFEMEKLNFLAVEELPRTKKSIFALPKTKDPEKVVDIACGESFCVATTNFNAVYNIPSKTHQFPQAVKIKKICCGFEHAILLTANGDCYTWGTGLRGQLGHGVIADESTPRLVNRLAGLKLIDIGAGSWSCAAVSAFGDLYVWGWNSHGQLGLKVYKSDIASSIQQKNQAVYAEPTLVNLDAGAEISAVKVFCGAKHTIVRTSKKKLFVTGSNTFGQLGVQEFKDVTFQKLKTRREIFLDQFQELDDGLKWSDFDCYASYSCTAFIKEK